jgi:hypothetical protein
VAIGEHVVPAFAFDDDAGAGFVDVARRAAWLGIALGLNVDDAGLGELDDPFEDAPLALQVGNVGGQLGKKLLASRGSQARSVGLLAGGVLTALIALSARTTDNETSER